MPRSFTHLFGLIVLPLAGLLILGLVIVRERQLAEWKEQGRFVAASLRILAPRFELADHRKHLVKLEGYLGRQRILLVFFDSRQGADRDPRVQRLVECYEMINAQGIEILAVSSATPYANQEAEKRLGRRFPFSLLTDIDLKTPVNEPVHRQWGRYDEEKRQTLTGMFLIERDGTVAVDESGVPLPVMNEDRVLDELCRGHWPSP